MDAPSPLGPTALHTPHILIVGGGFAGLAAAKHLARLKAKARVTLLDKRNHHVFQPLLYQVATAAISPADIAAPIRGALRDATNCHVMLAEVSRVDLARREVTLSTGATLSYDYLILACGATHSYFNHPEWEAMAPGLKTLEDATEIRRRILLAFESAEYETSEERRRAALAFAIVGGGPTGVELAGAIKEIAAATIPRDFRTIDTTTARVVLLEGSDRLLAAFPPELSDRAKRDLEAMGVEVRLNAKVTSVTDDGVRVGDELIPAASVLWAAGVKASPLGQSMGAKTDRAGRVQVEPDLSVPGHPEAFVVGDMAAATSKGTPVPGVAQGALQGGAFVARLIAKEITAAARSATATRATAASRPAFVYHDKGTMATIGRAKAVAQIGPFNLGGFIAWALWGGIHVAFLINYRNRMSVLAKWFWNWVLFARDARLIMEPREMEPREMEPREVEPREVEPREAPTPPPAASVNDAGAPRSNRPVQSAPPSPASAR